MRCCGSDCPHRAPCMRPTISTWRLRPLSGGSRPAKRSRITVGNRCLPITPPADHPSSGLAISSRMWELCHNLGAYDAAYVALAEALGCELLTGDVKLKNAAGHHATVIITR